MRDDHDERVERHARLSATLAAMSDAEIHALVADAEDAATGVGGHTGTVTVGGEAVFVKNVPLTALELTRRGSTANLFDLPMFYHYGIGSAGFGAWRELAVHTMTTEWVLAGTFAGFPLTYHWRVLPHAPGPADPVERDVWVEHWEGSPAVRARLDALAEAPAVVTLFVERIPYTMDAWLTAQRKPHTLRWPEADLRRGVKFLRDNGLVHFDAHFRNLLTDGHRIYFADFGLALHEGFELDAEEAAFLERHRFYDRAYTIGHHFQWLVNNGYEDPARHREIATIVLDWWRALEKSRATPYPAERLDRALLAPDLGAATSAVVQRTSGEHVLTVDDPAELAAPARDT